MAVPPSWDRPQINTSPTLLYEAARIVVLNHPGRIAIDLLGVAHVQGRPFDQLLADHGEFALGVVLRELDALQLAGPQLWVGFDHFERAVARALEEVEGEGQAECD